MSEPLSTFGIELPHVVAGAAVGIVRAVIRPGQSVVQSVTTTTAGMLCAVYGTPLAERYAGLGDADVAVTNSVAFLIGLVGMSLAEGLVLAAHAGSRRPRLRGGAVGDAVNAALDAQPPAPPVTTPPPGSGDPA